jgi:hypothetical protein
MYETNPSSPKVTLPVTGPYTAKDQAKSDKANKFIGRGSHRSSTEQYRRAWGDHANYGTYGINDIVFISAEGNRPGSIKPDFQEIKTAMDARAGFITDDKANRNRPYNTGERAVAEYLIRNGYQENPEGIWTRR